MARTSAVFRLMAVISSAVLIALYVGWQAGAFQSNPPNDDVRFSSTKSKARFEAVGTSERTVEASVNAPTFMPGSKYAPLDFMPEGVASSNEGESLPTKLDDARLRKIHAYSSKSAVPLVIPDRRIEPVLPSLKRTIPLITAPSQSKSKASANKDSDQKFSGTKSFVPLIQVPAKNDKSAGKPPATGSKSK